MVWQASVPKGEVCLEWLAQGRPERLSFDKSISRLEFFGFGKNTIRDFDINLKIRIGDCRTS